MSNDILELVQFRETRNGKWKAVRLGYAKPDGNGGVYVNFDALPLPGKDGETSVKLQVPRGKDDLPPSRDNGESYARQTRDAGAPMAGVDMEDPIPFAPEWRA